MSKNIMKVYELARQHGEPVSDFVAKLNSKGFTVKSHLSSLTAEDLVTISALLSNTGLDEVVAAPASSLDKKIYPECCSVVITKVSERQYTISIVDSKIINGMLEVTVVEQDSSCRSKAEALIEADRIGYKYKIDRT
jgi:Translation initiation factor IF-2, N-terminal region